MNSQVRVQSYVSNESKSPPSPDPKRSPETCKPSFKTWVYATWAIVGHCIISVGVAVFVRVYMANRAFHVTDRFTTVQAIGANVTLPFAPTQPDIVTTLTGILYVHKLVLALWTGPLCWRVAIFLMEKRGLDHRNFKMLIKYQTLFPKTYFQSRTRFLTGALFLAIFAASASELILTGSISWVSKNELARNLRLDPVKLLDVDEGILNSSYIEGYKFDENGRDITRTYSVGLVNVGWGHATEKGVYKRVSSSDQIAALPIGSAIENITLPYFEVHSLEWTKNASDIPNFPYNEDSPVDKLLQPLHNSTPVSITYFPLGYALLVPNVVTNWSNDPLNSTIIHDRRLLVLSLATNGTGGEIDSLTHALPKDAYWHRELDYYSTFAWVTFSAGVGRCKKHNCIVSSPSTVRNNTPITLEPNRLTSWALSLAPSISISLVTENSSIPFLWDNIDDYVEAVLARSYSGAWTIMNNQFSNLETNSSYIPAYPALMAEVHRGRVYGWLGIQLFAALLGTAFLVFQSRESEFFSGDPSLDVFYLDTSAVKKGNEPDPFDGIEGTLIVQSDGNRGKVAVA